MVDNNEQIPNLEVFKIGRMRVLFPPDITEDELQFTSMILFSYIQTVKYKAVHKDIWNIRDRIAKSQQEDNNNNKNVNQAGVS